MTVIGITGPLKIVGQQNQADNIHSFMVVGQKG